MKKMIAPIVITIVFLVYLIIYGIMIMYAGGWMPVFLVLTVPLAALGAAMIYVLITRIREIRKGEEDDLSNY